MYKQYTKEELRAMPSYQIEAILLNRVYDAAMFAEALEHAGLLIGSGHHYAQEVANSAKFKLTPRLLEWDKEEEGEE